jgi:hypothetical protein
MDCLLIDLPINSIRDGDHSLTSVSMNTYFDQSILQSFNYKRRAGSPASRRAIDGYMVIVIVVVALSGCPSDFVSVTKMEAIGNSTKGTKKYGVSRGNAAAEDRERITTHRLLLPFSPS